jgi:hypothetical protein
MATFAHEASRDLLRSVFTLKSPRASVCANSRTKKGTLTTPKMSHRKAFQNFLEDSIWRIQTLTANVECDWLPTQKNWLLCCYRDLVHSYPIGSSMWQSLPWYFIITKYYSLTKYNCNPWQYNIRHIPVTCMIFSITPLYTTAICNSVHYIMEYSASTLTWPDIICNKVTLLHVILGRFNKQLIWTNSGFQLMAFLAVLNFFASGTISKIQ